ncbi:MAG TPA: DUF3999 domain-containing protein [Burkholderiales bacterium]|nr:DUF3999 domain-containing protein [Burkholderiales bacterium]
MKQFVTLAFAGYVAMAGAAETPADFAYAMPIVSEAGEALYQVELPPALYRGVARADLGDLRVFNAKGEVVPHAFRQRPVADKVPSDIVTLPLFPLRADRAGQLEDLQVRVQKRPDGTLVDIRGGQKRRDAGTTTLGYLLDASQNKQPMQALLFDWKAPRDGFVGKIHVEGSDDLARWHTVARDASLLELEFGGHRLERKRIEVRGQKYKYLRLSWPPNQKPLQLTSVRAEMMGGVQEPQRSWLTLTASAGKNPGEYEYDAGGPVPFDRLRIDLPQTNTLAQMRILTRDKPSEEWRALGERLVYRLQRDGNEVTSSEIAITGRGGRLLLLRVDQKGGGIGSGHPVVQIGYEPQQLVFAARGEAPFQLAYGSHAARAASFSITTLIPGYGTQKEFPVKTATLGEPRKLAGEKQLRAPPDYRKWALWGSLVLGVAALGFMAYRLFRQMAAGAPGGAKSPHDADR